MYHQFFGCNTCPVLFTQQVARDMMPCMLAKQAALQRVYMDINIGALQCKSTLKVVVFRVLKYTGSPYLLFALSQWTRC